MEIDGVDMDAEGHTFAATRAKPANANKYAKSVGAKKTKRLELDYRSESTLSAQDATMCRPLAARCNYLAQDRPDLAFGSKELCRNVSVPTRQLQEIEKIGSVPMRTTPASVFLQLPRYAHHCRHLRGYGLRWLQGDAPVDIWWCYCGG